MMAVQIRFVKQFGSRQNLNRKAHFAGDQLLPWGWDKSGRGGVTLSGARMSFAARAKVDSYNGSRVNRKFCRDTSHRILVISFLQPTGKKCFLIDAHQTLSPEFLVKLNFNISQNAFEYFSVLYYKNFPKNKSYLNLSKILTDLYNF